jgi:hypothetical protein
VTSDITSFEQWLSDATRGLSAESAARVREEIQQHYDSAREAGGDAADVIGALGHPRTANRAYRKVLLTESEARMAPTLTRPKRFSFPAMLLTTAVFVAFFSWMGLHSRHHDPGFWPVMIAIFCTMPIPWLFPRTTIARIRSYVYAQGVSSVLVVAVACWFRDWTSALVYGAARLVMLSFDYYLTYRTWLIFRKLGIRT